MVYNRLSDFLKGKYGERVGKICIDGGFTCPNRDGSKSTLGCVFCGEAGSGEQILFRTESVAEQIDRELKVRGEGKYIAYYQNFTNTYAPIDVLRERFLPAVENPNIVALAIATRPDCVSLQVVKLLSSLSAYKDITVELGLQTANDEVAKSINRCYESSEFTRAVSLLSAYGISVVTHIILGLPGEGKREIAQTVDFLNRHDYAGIKIHSLYVTKGTRLATMYHSGEYKPLEFEEYIDMATYVLTHISPKIIIHRLTGDGEKSVLLAPDWSKNKIRVLNAITKSLLDNGWSQGCYFS